GPVHSLPHDELRPAITELVYVPRQRHVHHQLLGEEHEQRAIIANRHWTNHRRKDPPAKPPRELVELS
ncbi:MAG: hypothetical protein ACK557_14395, partial [Planctomycetota bacterium]